MPIAADVYYSAYQGGAGERPTVVLVHGAGGTHLYWPSEVRRIQGYRVLAVDLPGHGKSAGRGFQSIEAYVEALLEWMQAVPLHQAVFVGHSMGGAIALSMALDHGEHVTALGLLGSGARLRVHPEILQRTASDTTLQSAIALVVANSFSEQAPERLVDLAARRMGETRRSVLYGDFLACDAFNEMDRLGEIDKPSIVITGEEDRMTPTRYAQFLADSLPNAELHVIPQAGHMVMLEKPQQVANLLKRFLGGLRL